MVALIPVTLSNFGLIGNPVGMQPLNRQGFSQAWALADIRSAPVTCKTNLQNLSVRM